MAERFRGRGCPRPTTHVAPPEQRSPVALRESGHEGKDELAEAFLRECRDIDDGRTAPEVAAAGGVRTAGPVLARLDHHGLRRVAGAGCGAGSPLIRDEAVH
jgi:hypothetical protein